MEVYILETYWYDNSSSCYIEIDGVFYNKDDAKKVGEDFKTEFKDFDPNFIIHKYEVR